MTGGNTNHYTTTDLDVKGKIRATQRDIKVQSRGGREQINSLMRDCVCGAHAVPSPLTSPIALSETNRNRTAFGATCRCVSASVKSVGAAFASLSQTWGGLRQNAQISLHRLCIGALSHASAKKVSARTLIRSNSFLINKFAASIRLVTCEKQDREKQNFESGRGQ